MTVTATAADMTGAIRAPKTRPWEDKTLADIAGQIAGEAGLAPMVEAGIAARAISASWRDGGVREKRIPFDPDHWLLMPLHPWHPADAFARARACLGAPYDLPGILMSINDRPEVRAMFSRFDLAEVETSYSVSAKGGRQSRAREFLVSSPQ